MHVESVNGPQNRYKPLKLMINAIFSLKTMIKSVKIDPQISHRPTGYQVADAVFGTVPELAVIAMTISYL